MQGEGVLHLKSGWRTNFAGVFSVSSRTKYMVLAWFWKRGKKRPYSVGSDASTLPVFCCITCGPLEVVLPNPSFASFCWWICNSTSHHIPSLANPGRSLHQHSVAFVSNFFWAFLFSNPCDRAFPFLRKSFAALKLDSNKGKISSANHNFVKTHANHGKKVV